MHEYQNILYQNILSHLKNETTCPSLSWLDLAQEPKYLSEATQSSENACIDLSRLNLGDRKVILLAQELLNHPEVTQLNVSYNQLTHKSTEILGKNKYLRELNLSGNQLDDKTGEYFRNSKLEVLDLSRNYKVGNSSVKNFAKSNRIISLFLSNTAVTNLNTLKKNISINILDIGFTLVTDFGVKGLINHPSLQYLHLSGTQVSKECINELISTPSVLCNLIIDRMPYKYVKEEMQQRIVDATTRNLEFIKKKIILALDEAPLPLVLKNIVLNYLIQNKDF